MGHTLDVSQVRSLQGVFQAGAPVGIAAELHDVAVETVSAKVLGKAPASTKAATTIPHNAPDTRSSEEQIKTSENVKSFTGEVKGAVERKLDPKTPPSSNNPFKKILTLLKGSSKTSETQVESKDSNKERSFGDFRAVMPKTFGAIQDRAPTGKEFCQALGVSKASSIKNPQLAKVAQALESYNPHNRNEGLKTLSETEHTIYEWFSANPAHVADTKQLAVVMHTLELIQKENNKLIGDLVAEGEKGEYPTELIHSLGPGETVQEVKDLWKDLVQGDKGLKVVDEFPARGIKAPEPAAGFRNETFGSLARLISTPKGREIIRDVMKNGADRPVQIIPRRTGEIQMQAGQYSPRELSNVNKAGGTSGFVLMPHRMTDAHYKAYDKNKSDIIFPTFVMIGHELRHAVNALKGQAQNEDKEVPAGWEDKEEMDTIVNWENAIRKEHNIPERHGVKGDITTIVK